MNYINETWNVMYDRRDHLIWQQAKKLDTFIHMHCTMQFQGGRLLSEYTSLRDMVYSPSNRTLKWYGRGGQKKIAKDE